MPGDRAMSEQHECGVCGREFGTERGLNIHKGNGHDEPYKNREKLRELYVEEDLSSHDIADRLDTDQATIQNWITEFGIETDSQNEGMIKKVRKKPPKMDSVERGYERVKTTVSGETVQVYIHRLTAVAEYGIEAVKGKDVHHKNEIKWDNRAENLQLFEPSEHRSTHYEQREIDENGRFV